MTDVLKEVFQTSRKIYLDYNGTTPLDPQVQAAIAVSLREDWGNPNTQDALGRHAAAVIEKARTRVAAMVNGLPHEVKFTSGGTEGNNMLIAGLCQSASHNHPLHVITTNVEHDSVALPLKNLQETKGLQVTEVDVSGYDAISAQVLAAIQPNTVLITIMAANNETGVIMPLRDIGQRLVEVNQARAGQGLRTVFFHSDGAQILGKEPVDVVDLNLDAFTIVGHKFYGPRVGAIWSRVPIPPLLFGGGDSARPGTPNTPMIVGLGEAACLVNANLASHRSAMEQARLYLELQLQSLPIPVTVNCAKLPRLVNTSNVSFRLPEPCTGRNVLDRCERVLAGVGAACHAAHTTSRGGSRVLLNSGVAPGDAAMAIRLSLGRDACITQVDDIVCDLKQAISSLSLEYSPS